MSQSSQSADSRQADEAAPHTRFPFAGPLERAMFAIVAVACGFFAIPALLELLKATSAGSSSGGDVALLIVGTLFFGLPALASAIVAIRPPAGEVVVDATGIRVENIKRPYGVEWHELRAVAISITWPTEFVARTPLRRRLRRHVHILFAPVDAAVEPPRELQPWPHHAEFTRALKLVVSPLAGEVPPLVRGLEKAMRAAAPEKFAGVQRGVVSP